MPCLVSLTGKEADFQSLSALPEVDQIIAPRVEAPVLMLNGRFDFIFTGTNVPQEHNRRVLYETDHDIPRNEWIKETLDWLDRYLGPVK
jgi:hypothetical protein